MSEEVKDTAIAGAEPADKGQKPESPTGAEDVALDKDGKPLPWNEQPKWKSARAAEKALTELMTANGIEDVDDLKDLIASGAKVKGKQVNLDNLDEIVEKAKTLEKYEAYWKDQEEKKRRQGEEPEQTIARLERELKEREQRSKVDAESKKQAEAAQRAVKFYEREVRDSLSEVDSPKDHKEFIGWALGIGNAANEIDITDRKAVRKLVQDALKRKESYDQSVIDTYLKTKGEVPKVPAGGLTPTETPKRVTLKDARREMTERLTKAFGGS